MPDRPCRRSPLPLSTSCGPRGGIFPSKWVSVPFFVCSCVGYSPTFPTVPCLRRGWPPWTDCISGSLCLLASIWIQPVRGTHRRMVGQGSREKLGYFLPPTPSIPNGCIPLSKDTVPISLCLGPPAPVSSVCFPLQAWVWVKGSRYPLLLAGLDFLVK